MIRNCLFDLGNVLARFDTQALTAACIQDETVVDAVRDIVFERAYWDLLDSGKLSDNDFKRTLCHLLPEHLREIGCAVFEHWVENMTPIAGMQQLVAELKTAGVKLYLISNISIGFTETYKQVPWLRNLLSQFDGLAFSGALQAVKPNAAIFEYVLHTYDLKPEECLFIDDSALNINGAAAVGIPGYLFDGDANKLKRYLQEHIHTA